MRPRDTRAASLALISDIGCGSFFGPGTVFFLAAIPKFLPAFAPASADRQVAASSFTGAMCFCFVMLAPSANRARPSCTIFDEAWPFATRRSAASRIAHLFELSVEEFLELVAGGQFELVLRDKQTIGQVGERVFDE